MDDLYAINAAKTEFREAFNSGDVSVLLALADPDVVNFSDGHPSEFGESGLDALRSRLLLIWLLQQAPIGSVKGCPGRRFLRRYGNSKPTSPMKRPANSTWWPVAGLMASSVLDAGISEPTHW